MDSPTAKVTHLLRAWSGGDRATHEIRLPDIGVVLYYAPHNPKHGTAAEEREVAQMIPITATDATR